MWIKICGMTTPEAVEAALGARADAIGFVFSSSPRRLTPAAAARLAAPARGRLACVAVTRGLTQRDLDEIVAAFEPDALQTDAEEFVGLDVPQSIASLPVLRAGCALPQRLPARVLYEGPVSGVGVPCDWSSARGLAARTELVLAGGLTEHNVGAAIENVRPFGVDVSSGVEEWLGRKSPEKILRFVEAARQAFQRVAQMSAAGEEEVQ
jgi:phosphoribosylanthranilate isomerase